MQTYITYTLLLGAAIGLNAIAYKFLKQRWNLWLGCGVPALFIMAFLWQVSQPPDQYLFSDFNKAYYPAGRLILENPSQLYEESCVTGYVNIPIIAYLFTPFSLLSLPAAQILFMLLTAAAIGLTFYLFFKLTNLSGWQQIAVISLFAINGPLLYSIRDGNATHLLLPLFAAGLFCLKKEREVWLGIIIAIAALIKIPFFLLGGYFLLRGRWRVLIAMAATVLAITGASVLLFGFDVHLSWYQQCIQPYSGKPVAAYNVQSLDGFLARLLSNDNLLNWKPLSLGWNFKLLRYGLMALLTGATIWFCWRSKSPDSIEAKYSEFSIALCFSMLISPISWSHYYSLLLIPLSLYFSDRLAIPHKKIWLGLILLSVYLISLPVIRVGNERPIIQLILSKFLISHYFLGGVLLLAILAIAVWMKAKDSQISEN